MNLFLAAVYTNQYRPGQKLYNEFNDAERQITAHLPNILESYHYVHKQKFVDEMRADGAKVFLDSGAFSAFTLGVTIDIGEYCRYIQRNIDIIRVEDGDVMASVLDGIGDPLQTYRNQLHMEHLGVRPLPCFHFGEDPKYLEWYVRNYSYITLGGMVGKSSDTLIKWLDELWERYLTDSSGKARLKVHAFGITAIPIMQRYPWHSVDSSSWIQSTAFGTVVTVEHGPISISVNSPSRHDAGRHFSTMTDIERKHLDSLIQRRGFTYERLSTHYPSRAAFNLAAYKELGDKMNICKPDTFVRVEQGLF